MPATQKLSDLLLEIDATIQNRFAGRNFWIKAEVTDVKKYPDKRWCFLKFIEKEGKVISSEVKGIFWSNTYQHIENFERETQQQFASGLEITCNVRVRFHKRFGLNLEVLAIDFAYAVGLLEIEKKQTIDRLLKENPGIRMLPDGSFSTPNKRVELPTVLQRIALIAAPNSDGYRDFTKVLEQNKYGYAFSVSDYNTQVQGDNAADNILRQLQKIEVSAIDFDAVVIVRGGGSDTDFKCFNSFELANRIACFPLPVLTGIGHDRNSCIVDLVARAYKTPTEAGAFIVDKSMVFEQELLDLKERFFFGIKNVLQQASNKLAYQARIVKSCSPSTILNKGFAILVRDQEVITGGAQVEARDEIQAVLRDAVIYTTVNKKEADGNRFVF